ncbi:MAG: signal peptidase II [Solobacterium sp.]|nr:signal peptidase II [Solobacterium sp.]
MLVYWIVIAILVALDQLSKTLVASDPAKYADLPLIPGFFHITYVKNTGAAWSILSGQRVFLSLLAAVAAVGMAAWLHQNHKKNPPLMNIALTLMIAGALGNLIDRLMLGYVRDFLNFYIFGYDFPVFNVADICLSIGVCLLLLCSFLDTKKEETENDADNGPENRRPDHGECGTDR